MIRGGLAGGTRLTFDLNGLNRRRGTEPPTVQPGKILTKASRGLLLTLLDQNRADLLNGELP